MSEQAKCKLCGEPMPPGEEMFNYHGYSGPCPKPALAQPPTRRITEGPFWAVLMPDGTLKAITATGVSLWKDPGDAVANAAFYGGRVVRVRVTYEVEEA